jgi:protein O-mannosyl-transferase
MRRSDLIAAAAIVIGTFVAYFPAIRGGFLWDDDQHVIRTSAEARGGEAARGGETRGGRDTGLGDLRGLVRIWFDPGATPQYYPLVHTSFWLENRIYGARPAGYHIVNILLHALVAVLFAGLLRRLSIPGAWIAAALFALHPVAVESAAWITERKNLLSAVFYLLAMGAYLEWSAPEGRRRNRLYVASCLLFVCALLSKTVTATLPAALLLVAWWRRGRITRRDVRPLLPFFLIGIGMAAVTIGMERHHVGARGGEWSLSLLDRLGIAGRALFFYAGKLVFPARLTFIYPRWDLDRAGHQLLVWPAAAVTILALLWFARRRITRAPLAAALFFAGTLVPALGFFNVFPMRYSFVADHFQYLASLGPFALAGAASARIPRRPRGIAGVSLAVLLGVLTWSRCGAFRDAETLWRDTIAKNPACWMAQHNLGLILEGRGEVADAITRYRAALRIRSDLEETHFNLANLLARTGRIEDARLEYLEALKSRPDYVDAWNNLGNVLQLMGRGPEAIESYRRAVACDPGHLIARKSLAYALGLSGNAHASIVEYRAAIRLAPDDPGIMNNLAWLLATAADPADRDPAEAVRLAEGACRRTGFADASMLHTLATAYAEAGRLDPAISAIERAIDAAPRSGHTDLIPQMRSALERYRSGVR